MTAVRSVGVREALRGARKRDERVCRGLRALIWYRNSNSMETR